MKIFEILQKEHLLGVIPDKYIAKKYCVSIASIFLVRRKLGINASHLHFSNNYPRKIDLKIIISELGTIKDVDLARKYNVSRERIRQLRKRYGIPRYKKIKSSGRV